VAAVRAPSPRHAGLGRAIASLASGLLEFTLPQRCPGCGGAAHATHLLCEPCRGRIPRLETALCVRCLAAGREAAGCRAHAGFTARAAWIYDERAALVVQALKYGERPGLARGLGVEMARALPPGYRPDLVLEVPLHPARRRERGYNQAALLADALAEAIAAPRLAEALTRVRPTRTQARLDPAARRANVAGAFRVPRPAALAGRSVLIVDDVLTTGATLEASLAPLKAAGAEACAAVLAWAQ
jgi:ComF family protein